MLLINQKVKEEITKGLELLWDEWNKDTTYENLWDTAKVVLSKKSITANVSI